jgi:hypothetical protein
MVVRLCGKKPTVSAPRTLLDCHLLTLSHGGLSPRRRVALGQVQRCPHTVACMPPSVKDVGAPSLGVTRGRPGTVPPAPASP